MEIHGNWLNDRRARLQRAFEEVYPDFEGTSDIEERLSPFDREIAGSAGTLLFNEIGFSNTLGIDNAFLYKEEDDVEIFFSLYAQMNFSEKISEKISPPLDTPNIDPEVIDAFFAEYSDEETAENMQTEILLHPEGSSEIIINPSKDIDRDLYFQIYTLEMLSKPIKKEPPKDFWKWN